MAASTNYWRSSKSIWTGSLIVLAGLTVVLAGYLIGLAAYMYWPKAVPGAAQYDKGAVLMAEDDLQGAIEAFNEAIDKNHLHALAVFYQAEANQRLGNSESAIAGFTEALRLNKEIAGMKRDEKEKLRPVPLGYVMADAYLNRGKLLIDARKPLEAIADFSETIGLNPEQADAYCGRGAAYLATDSRELAIVDLKEAILLDPKSHNAYCWLARANFAAGKCAEAIEDARKAIHLDARCGDAFLTLGSALLSYSDQQPYEALKYIEEATRLDRKLTAQADDQRARAYFSIGVSLTKAKKPLEANSAFDEAKRLNPKYVPRAGDQKPATEAELVRAKSLSAQKLFDEALNEFTSILRMDPKSIDALLGRGSAFLGKNDSDSAIRDFDRAIELDQNSADAYCLRGQAYANKGDFYHARTDTTEAIRLKPDYALAYFYRADAYCKEKNFDLALANLAEAVRLDRKVRPRDLQAEFRARDLYVEIYQGQASDNTAARKWEKAIDSLLAIRKLDKDFPFETSAKDVLTRQLAQAYQDLGSARLKAQNWDEAIDVFEKAIALDKNRARELKPSLAQASRERGFDHANHREFSEAVRDLNKALDLDEYSAQNWRFCGLTCCKLAEYCHDRRLTAGEEEQWKAAIRYLKRAIRLDSNLKYELRDPLEDAQGNLDRLSALGQRPANR